MARSRIEPLDIEGRDDVRELVEEVRAGARPRLLRLGNRFLAMILPLHDEADEQDIDADAPGSIEWPVVTEEDRAAFRAAAGGWKDFDAETFLEQNRFSRDLSSRPPVDW